MTRRVMVSFFLRRTGGGSSRNGGQLPSPGSFRFLYFIMYFPGIARNSGPRRSVFSPPQPPLRHSAVRLRPLPFRRWKVGDLGTDFDRWAHPLFAGFFKKSLL